MSFKKAPSSFLSRLEPYRIVDSYTNCAFKVPHGDSSIFLKIYGPKLPRIRYELRKSLFALGFRQPVEYQGPFERKRFEEDCLRHWKTNGYAVPQVVDNPFPELSGLPVLTTGFLDGVTMKDILKATSSEVILEKLALLFSVTAQRHRRAMSQNDAGLIHIDSNARNVLFSDSTIYHVDFEMGRPWEPVTTAICREMTKLLISIAEGVQPEMRAGIMDVFKECYGVEDVKGYIRQRILGRPLQVIHRFNDKRKKQKNPARVTLYDLASYLF